MRLGFWNRLAVVASALTIAILPIYLIVGENEASDKAAATLYEICSENAQVSLRAYDFKAYYAAMDICHREMFGDLRIPTPFWPRWRDYVGAAIALCAVVYAALAGATATVRWVWRGRTNPATP